MPPHPFPRGASVALFGALVLTACDSGAPTDRAGEEELITQVEVTLANTADASDTVTITATDADGDGVGLTFSPASVALRPGATYDGAIELRDTINGEDITEEVAGEAEEHLLRYAFQPVSAGAVVATDAESDYTAEDTNGGDFAVGLTFRATVAAGASGSGALEVVLYHFGAGPKTSDTATSDEIDVDIAFPISFQAAPTAH